MDKLFSRKDLFLFAAITLIVVLLVLIMYQIDRQWIKLSSMTETVEEQSRDLQQLRRLVASGDIVQNNQPSSGIAPVFKRAAQAAAKEDYAEGGWLLSAFGVNLKSITPFISEDAYASQIQQYVLDTLLSRDPDTLEWQGMVASAWQVSDNGLNITFQIRPDIVFSDGEPLTARDIAFSYQFIMNPAIHAPRERAYYSKINRVIAKNDYEVVFEYKEPYYSALELAGSMVILPRHFYEPYLQKPNQFNQSKGLLLGSGPYRLADPKSWRPDKGLIQLVRNQRYWGDVQPSFDRLVWRIIENDSARLTAFRNGEIDSYVARPREYKTLLKDVQIQSLSDHYEYMSPTKGYSYIGWNQLRKDKPTWFANRTVREAMAYLIDREKIVKEIYLGYGEPALGPFSPLGKQHNPNLIQRQFNLKKAKSLLKQAGFEDRDGDGVIEDQNHQPFSFDLIYFQSNEDTKRTVLLIKDMFTRAGIQLNPKPSEWSVMLDTLKKRDFDAITLGWTGSIESDLYQIFHSSQISDGGNNNIGYQSAELDKLIEQARANVNEEERMVLWQKAEELLYRDQPYTFLVRLKSLVFVNRRIRNVAKTRIGLNLGVTPFENYIPEQLQVHH